MGNVGRFICVSLPFILTAASIICLLIVGLTGVTSTNTNLYMFRVNMTDMSISSSSISKLISSRADWHDSSVLGTSGSTSSVSGSSGTSTGASAASSASAASAAASSAASSVLSGSNITASDLALDNLYDVNLWGYCATDSNGDKTCTKAQFDWASTYLNTSSLTSLGTASGYNVTLPTEISSALKAFKAVTKWTEVVYIIAIVALGIELFVGFFSYCSRAVSCVTYLVSGIATAAVIAAASMVTAMSVVVIGAVEGTAKWYGVEGNLNTQYLATAWLAVAFSMGASLFWLFSCCCCKRDPHTSRRSNKNREAEKPFLASGAAGAYAPIGGDQHHHNTGYNSGYGQTHHNNNNGRYEPYSHSNV